MKHFVSGCCRMLIFGTFIVGLKEDYPENGMAIIYSGDDSFIKESYKNSTTIIHMKTIHANLSVVYLLLTKNVQQNFESLCYVFAKTKVVSVLFLPGSGFNLTFPMFLAVRSMNTPQFHFQSWSTMYNQKNMFMLSLIPTPKDNVPATMKILQKYPWSSIAIICDNLDENNEAKLLIQEHAQYTHDFTPRFTNESIHFFQMVLGQSTMEHIRQVTDILAKIKLSRIDKVVVYANADEVDMLLSIAKMMEMTGANYTWILPWKTVNTSTSTSTSKTMILRTKNTAKMENLLSDAFEVISRGFRDFCKNQTTCSIPSFGCFDTGDHSFSETFFRYLIQQSFVGKTGNIEFDDKGNRINADYEIVESTNSGSVWRDVSEAATMVPSVNGKKKQTKKLRVITALTEPFASMNKDVDNHSTCGTGLPCKLFSLQQNTNKQFCCDGIAIELLHMLETDLSFDIELHLSKDGKYGILDMETKQWNGMIGELIRDEADMIVSDLIITDDRAKVVDFTQPFMEVGMGIMVRVARRSTTSGILGFLKPVAAHLWIIIFATIFVMGVLFWIMEKVAVWILDKFAAHKDGCRLRHKRQFSIGASLHYSWSTVVRTQDKVTRPTNTSAMIGAIGLSLCFLVFITTYTAQLASFLVAEERVSLLTDGIQDRKLQNPPEGFKIAAVSGSSTETFFRKSNDPLFRNIWRHMEENNVPTTDIGIEKLSKREIDVFFGDYSTLVYHAAKDKDCALRVMGRPIFQSGFGIAFQKNSSWTTIVSQKLLEYQKHEVFLMLSHRWLKRSCQDPERSTANRLSENTFRRMSLYDLSGVFLMVVAAMVLSLGLLAMENYFFKRHCKKRLHTSREDGRITAINEFQTSQLPESSGTTK